MMVGKKKIQIYIAFLSLYFGFDKIVSQIYRPSEP